MLEFVDNKQMQFFSFNPLINLVEEDKGLLGVTSLECTNSVFIITNENNSFSITIPGRRRRPIFLEDGIFDKLMNLLKLNSEIDIELFAEEVRKRGSQTKIVDRQYKIIRF